MMDGVDGLISGDDDMKNVGSMRRWIILWVLLVTVYAAFAGWQEIKARDEEGHTKALWHELIGTDDVSSLTECIEKNANGRDIEACTAALFPAS
jgi:hypothetical protein